jgi:hypothetical protein
MAKGIQSPNLCVAAPNFYYLIDVIDPIEPIPIIQDIMAMCSNNELNFFGKFMYQLSQSWSIYRVQHLKSQSNFTY